MLLDVPVQVNRTLTHLNVSGNNIDKEAAKAFGAALMVYSERTERNE